MMWQDVVFMLGSALSIVFLAPTLRDATARVPLGTSLPSMGIGTVYGITFASLGMTFSAVGAVAAATMWALIACFRSPTGRALVGSRVDGLRLFAVDARRFVARRRRQELVLEEFVTVAPEHGAGRHASPGHRAAD